jgi:hypothetical protein
MNLKKSPNAQLYPWALGSYVTASKRQNIYAHNNGGKLQGNISLGLPSAQM